MFIVALGGLLALHRLLELAARVKAAPQEVAC